MLVRKIKPLYIILYTLLQYKLIFPTELLTPNTLNILAFLKFVKAIQFYQLF